MPAAHSCLVPGPLLLHPRGRRGGGGGRRVKEEEEEEKGEVWRQRRRRRRLRRRRRGGSEAGGTSLSLSPGRGRGCLCPAVGGKW